MAYTEKRAPDLDFQLMGVREFNLPGDCRHTRFHLALRDEPVICVDPKLAKAFLRRFEHLDPAGKLRGRLVESIRNTGQAAVLSGVEKNP